MKSKSKKLFSLEELSSVKKEFPKINKLNMTVRDSYFENNYFKKVKFQDKYNCFKSYFSDKQVVNILQKISHRNVRKLVYEYMRINKTETPRSNQLKFILHSICNGLRKKFGSRMLSFIQDLPIIDRPQDNFEILKDLSEIELSQEFEFENYSIEKEYRKIFIGFERLEYNNKSYMIVCDRNGNLQGRINELGYIEKDFVNRLRFNLFDILIDGEYSYVGAVLNCYCSICNKELTVPESIYFGMGPICRGACYPY